MFSPKPSDKLNNNNEVVVESPKNNNNNNNNSATINNNNDKEEEKEAKIILLSSSSPPHLPPSPPLVVNVKADDVASQPSLRSSTPDVIAIGVNGVSNTATAPLSLSSSASSSSSSSSPPRRFSPPSTKLLTDAVEGVVENSTPDVVPLTTSRDSSGVAVDDTPTASPIGQHFRPITNSGDELPVAQVAPFKIGDDSVLSTGSNQVR